MVEQASGLPKPKAHGKADNQLDLPVPPPANTTHVLRMQLRIGDHLLDETGDWQVLARIYSTAGGKTVNVRVQRGDNASVKAIRVWGAHERVTVRRS